MLKTFLSLLTILFIYLKLTHQIDWSWWWIMSPLLIPFGTAIVIIAGCVLIYGIGLLLETKEARANRQLAELFREYGRRLL